jgi:hypothetical protein
MILAVQALNDATTGLVQQCNLHQHITFVADSVKYCQSRSMKATLCAHQMRSVFMCCPAEVVCTLQRTDLFIQLLQSTPSQSRGSRATCTRDHKCTTPAQANACSCIEPKAHLSKYSHWVTGPNFPEIALTTSCPTIPPNMAHMALISALLVLANCAKNFSSTSALSETSCKAYRYLFNTTTCTAGFAHWGLQCTNTGAIQNRLFCT